MRFCGRSLFLSSQKEQVAKIVPIRSCGSTKGLLKVKSAIRDAKYLAEVRRKVGITAA